MSDDAQREYEAALENYRLAMIRIMDAKKHIPELPRDRRRRLRREEQERNRNAPPSPEVRLLLEQARETLRNWSMARLRDGIRASLERA
jgi:hypothetical protein